MLDEISAAVLFLIRLIEKSENFNQDQLQDFQKQLSELLVKRFENHWFPEQPCKGQGYRCIRVNERDPRDATLERAAIACGLKYEDLKLPVELTLWVDPNEVCCRFGEHGGSYCTLASFSGKENDSSLKEIDKIDDDSTEPKSQVAPLSVNNHHSANKNRRPQGRGSPKQNKAVLRGNKNWMGQGNMGTGFLQSPLPSWYTLIPHWLPPSPPPCHHNPSLMRSPGAKWGSPIHPNSCYHWQNQKSAVKV